MDFKDAYTDGLDEKSIERAKVELHEDENNREGAVETLREWLVQQKWLKTPTDTRFLLKYLRTKKYSQLEARKAIELYWETRTQIPTWMNSRDPRDPIIQNVISKGLIMKLPKTDTEGRIYLIQRPGCLSVDEIKNLGGPDAIFRAIYVVLDWATMDQRAQVNGLIGILDLTGYGLQHKLLLHTIENTKRMAALMQSNPARTKCLNLYNLPPAFDAVLSVIKTFMKPKLRERVKTHGRTLVSLYENVDMSVLPKEYLPDDYTGPCGGTLDEIIAFNQEELKKQNVVDYITDLSSGNYNVDINLKPSEGDVPSESFRKLNVE